ncbi:MAG: transcription antitermination factor NusB [Actinobacteria bacterium]|nr:transcription antitermination factor NusB [Actinomycetota bacterium]
MSARAKARKRALDFLYESKMRSEPALSIFERRGAGNLSEAAFVKELLTGISQNQVKISELINTYAQDWEQDRMPPIDVAILEIAIYELLFTKETDGAVAISQALELAKSLSTEGSVAYINGVLGRIFKLRDSLI